MWNLREQIAIAAVDQADFDVATEHIQALQKQFPDSVRVNRIQGMFYEAKGQFQEAITLYDELLKKDLTNIAIMKRKVSTVLKKFSY